MSFLRDIVEGIRSAINLDDYDWIDRHPDNGGRTYYGTDDGEGHTDWYDEDGNLDTSTDTPTDSDEYLERIEHPGCYGEDSSSDKVGRW